jgi:hypothetical protein
MSVSEAVRREVFARDKSECQFLHQFPTPATELSHCVHQGAGGLPEDHWVNQAGNIAASCGECHRKLSGPGKPYRWAGFAPGVAGVLELRTPQGQIVPKHDLWFYNKVRWTETQAKTEELEAWMDQERAAAWRVAEILAWLAENGIAKAVNDSADWLDLAAQVGITSAEARRRVRAEKFRAGLGIARATIGAVDIDVADRLRKIEDEAELCDVAGWFTAMPRAEAWARFNATYAGPERRRKYRAFIGTYREVEAASEEEALVQLGRDDGIIMVGGSVIAGTRKQEEA